MKNIYLDMDGTIADLYGVKDWLSLLIKEDTLPYEIAKPLVNENTLKEMERLGYQFNIISWGSKGATKEYNKRIRKAKLKWLKTNYPNILFNEIHIIKYGTPKKYAAKDKNGILIDDEKKNRIDWGINSLDPINFFPPR